jgi:hypothetical protein
MHSESPDLKREGQLEARNLANVVLIGTSGSRVPDQ